MEESIPKSNKFLVVNNDPNVFATLERKLLDTYPNCEVEKATSYEEAIDRLGSRTYDMVILFLK